MPMFDSLKSFRFWCHKVIPLVYDDSLSYYEFLCKVMQKLNEVIDLLNAHSQEIERFEQDITGQFNQLRAEFEAFRTEIREKIDAFEALFIEDFSTTKNYLEGDYVLYNDALYRATADITAGDFDSANWETVVFATDFANWRRELNARVIAFITQISTLVEHWLAMLASPYSTTKQYTANEVVNKDGTLYVSTAATTGDFDPTKWEEVILADWVTDNIRRMDEALDSMNVQIANINRDKADITNSQIVSVEKNIRSFYTESTDWADEVDLQATENISVYVYSVVEPNTAFINWFKENFQFAELHVDGESQQIRTATPVWIGNSVFITFTPFSRNDVVLMLHFRASPPQSFSLYRAKYEVSPSYNKVRPIADTIGYGFMDTNNIGYELAMVRSMATSVNNKVFSEIVPEIDKLSAFKVYKNLASLVNNLPYAGTKVESFSSTSDIPIEGVTYYYHYLNDDTMELLYNQTGVLTISNTSADIKVGIGTDPFTAFSNLLTFEAIQPSSQGQGYLLLPTSNIRLQSGQKIFLFLANTASTSINGIAVVSTGQGNNEFLDMPYEDAVTWLDERSSTLETQLGGKTIVSMTQTEYDALATKDANTIYIIVG